MCSAVYSCHNILVKIFTLKYNGGGKIKYPVSGHTAHILFIGAKVKREPNAIKPILHRYCWHFLYNVWSTLAETILYGYILTSMFSDANTSTTTPTTQHFVVCAFASLIFILFHLPLNFHVSYKMYFLVLATFSKQRNFATICRSIIQFYVNMQFDPQFESIDCNDSEL